MVNNPQRPSGVKLLKDGVVSVNNGGITGDHAGTGRVGINLKLNSFVIEHGKRGTPGSLRKHEEPNSR